MGPLTFPGIRDDFTFFYMAAASISCQSHKKEKHPQYVSIGSPPQLASGFLFSFLRTAGVIIEVSSCTDFICMLEILLLSNVFARCGVNSPHCVHTAFARNKVHSAEMIKLQAGNRKHINFTLTL